MLQCITSKYYSVLDETRFSFQSERRNVFRFLVFILKTGYTFIKCLR